MNSSEQARVGSFRPRSPANGAGGFEKEDRADAFAAREQAVAHGAMDGCGRHRLAGDQRVEMPVDEFLLGAEILRKIHALTLFGWLERLGRGLIAAADQRFHAGFGLFELLAALFAETYAAFEEFERAFERQVARFEFANDLFHFLERGFELRYRLFDFHSLHFNRQESGAADGGRLITGNAVIRSTGRTSCMSAIPADRSASGGMRRRTPGSIG